MRHLALSILLLAVATGTPAAAQEAPVWRVEHQASSLVFLFTQSGSETKGRFGTWSAEIAFDPEDLANSAVAVTIDLASADTGSGDRDQLLRSAPLFDVANHPQGRFVSTEIVAAGEGYEARGELTLRGVTRQVVLPFVLEIEDERAEAEGRLEIRRLDYGIGQGQWQDTSMVADPVAILFELRAERLD
ncbi:MAG: YceI family protein [Tistlia sp.]|uniref:YceI family protein n=1 Tax=Tistlia sp. TaxID=3057121 RepID=UPI0034A1ADB7